MPLDVADDEAAQRPEAQPPVADVLECGLDQLASDSLPLEAGRNDGVRQDAAARLLFVFEDRHIAVEFQFVAVSGRVVRDRVWVLFHVAAVFCRNPSKYGSEIVFLRAMMDRIADILLDWYAREGRDLPWRRTRDPYRIWLSEVILQQTRVAQGMDYYLRFTERFPDVRALAASSEDEVLKLWQGLGYYSRARNLHAAAREVVARFGGRFPSDYESVRSLRDIWQGLYEFPLIETPAAVDFAGLTSGPRFAELLGDAPWRLLGSVVLPLHRLSHRTIHAVVHRIETPLLTPAARGMAVASDSLGEYAVPRLIDRYLIKYQR